MSGLGGVRVLEAGRGVATAWAGKLLADLGAEVVKVEPPEGDPARRRGPFPPGGEGDGERSGLHLGLNVAKRSVVVADEDTDALRRLAASSRLVLHDSRAAEPWAGLRRDDPALVVCAITPFGRTGPYAGYRAEEVTVVHGGGWAWLSPGASERHDQPPLRPFGHQAHFQAAAGAVTVALAALDRAERTGRGEAIDYSMQAHVASMLEAAFISWTYPGQNPDRFGVRTLNPWGIFECADGLIFLVAVEQDQWERLVELMGTPEWATWEVFATAPARNENADVLFPLIEDWTRTRPVDELFHEAQARRIAMAPVLTMERLAVEPHLRERGFFVEVEHPRAGRLTHLGRAARLTDPWPTPTRGAPLLGEASGLLEEAPVPAGSPAGPPPEQAPMAPSGLDERPLAGVRVLDFSWVWAGPFATLQLAHLGADVIKVESPRRLCLGRRLPFHPPGVEPTVNTSGYYNQWNQGKRSVALDLASPRGVELARRLVARCDVVVENFAVGVMERLGLGYEELRTLRPDLIMASISGYGQTGPYRHYMGYGPTTAPLSGLASMTGYPDDGKARELGIAFGDPAAGIQAALHVVAALVARRRTGRGQRIDVSLWEATAVNAVEGWMEWQLTGAQPAPMGNRDPRWAPCGCYPARGEEAWVTIACPTEESWRALRSVLDPSGDGPLWADALAEAAGRKAAEDHLDALLAAWTRQHDRWEVTRVLQAAGVAAFPTLSPQDLADDPHLEAQGFLVRLEHPEVGRRTHTGAPFQLEEATAGVATPAPLLGQHTDEVLCDVLGLGGNEVAELRASGVVS